MTGHHIDSDDQAFEIRLAIEARIVELRRRLRGISQQTGRLSGTDRGTFQRAATHSALRVRHAELAYRAVGGSVAEYLPAVYR